MIAIVSTNADTQIQGGNMPARYNKVNLVDQLTMLQMTLTMSVSHGPIFFNNMYAKKLRISFGCGGCYLTVTAEREGWSVTE